MIKECKRDYANVTWFSRFWLEFDQKQILVKPKSGKILT